MSETAYMISNSINGSSVILEGIRNGSDGIALTLDGNVYVRAWRGEWLQVTGQNSNKYLFGNKLLTAMHALWKEAGYTLKTTKCPACLTPEEEAVAK